MIFRNTCMLALLGVISGGCLYLFMDGAPARGTYFPHQIHTGKLADIKDNEGCLECHKGIDNAVDMSVRMIPDKKLCKNCHDTEESTKKVQLKPITRSVIRFDHNFHVKKGPEAACTDCHAKVVTDEYLPARGGHPLHKECGKCHEEWVPSPNAPMNSVRGTCRKCHQTKIMPRDHHENWDKLHRVKAAGLWKKSCAQCHADKTLCTNCHAGGYFRPESHDLGWVQTHRFEARNQTSNCKACHTDVGCRECHKTQGLAGTPKYRKHYDIGNHPPGWIADMPNTGNHHSVTARFKLDTCKACHVANDCTTCHFRRYPHGR